MNIAEIGARHLANALSGEMHHCTVTEWRDNEGKPVKVYWKPVTGSQQSIIDSASGEVNRTCMTVKERALNADGSKIFKDNSLASLNNDYDYDVIRTLALVISGDIGYSSFTEKAIEEMEKE